MSMVYSLGNKCAKIVVKGCIVTFF